MARVSLVFLGMLIPLIGLAATLTGRVMRVEDGDTVTIVDQNNVQHTVRLQDIQAPELSGYGGLRSKNALQGIVAGRHVIVDYDPDTGYHAPTGRLFMHGEDVNLRQLQRGMAAYQRSPQSDDAALGADYRQAEESAREERLGIWGNEESRRLETPSDPRRATGPVPGPTNPAYSADSGTALYPPLPETPRVPYGTWSLDSAHGSKGPEGLYPPEPAKRAYTPPLPAPTPAPYGRPWYPPPYGPSPWRRGYYPRGSGGGGLCPIGWR